MIQASDDSIAATSDDESAGTSMQTLLATQEEISRRLDSLGGFVTYEEAKDAFFHSNTIDIHVSDLSYSLLRAPDMSRLPQLAEQILGLGYSTEKGTLLVTDTTKPDGTVVKTILAGGHRRACILNIIKPMIERMTEAKRADDKDYDPKKDKQNPLYKLYKRGFTLPCRLAKDPSAFTAQVQDDFSYLDNHEHDAVHKQNDMVKARYMFVAFERAARDLYVKRFGEDRFFDIDYLSYPDVSAAWAHVTTQCQMAMPTKFALGLRAFEQYHNVSDKSVPPDLMAARKAAITERNRMVANYKNFLSKPKSLRFLERWLCDSHNFSFSRDYFTTGTFVALPDTVALKALKLLHDSYKSHDPMSLKKWHKHLDSIIPEAITVKLKKYASQAITRSDAAQVHTAYGLIRQKVPAQSHKFLIRTMKAFDDKRRIVKRNRAGAIEWQQKQAEKRNLPARIKYTLTQSMSSIPANSLKQDFRDLLSTIAKHLQNYSSAEEQDTVAPHTFDGKKITVAMARASLTPSSKRSDNQINKLTDKSGDAIVISPVVAEAMKERADRERKFTPELQGLQFLGRYDWGFRTGSMACARSRYVHFNFEHINLEGEDADETAERWDEVLDGLKQCACQDKRGSFYFLSYSSVVGLERLLRYFPCTFTDFELENTYTFHIPFDNQPAAFDRQYAAIEDCQLFTILVWCSGANIKLLCSPTKMPAVITMTDKYIPEDKEEVGENEGKEEEEAEAPVKKKRKAPERGQPPKPRYRYVRVLTKSDVNTIVGDQRMSSFTPGTLSRVKEVFETETLGATLYQNAFYLLLKTFMKYTGPPKVRKHDRVIDYYPIGLHFYTASLSLGLPCINVFQDTVLYKVASSVVKKMVQMFNSNALARYTEPSPSTFAFPAFEFEATSPRTRTPLGSNCSVIC